MELRTSEYGEGLHVPSTCGLTFSQYDNLRKVTWKLRVANKNVPSNKTEIAFSFRTQTQKWQSFPSYPTDPSSLKPTRIQREGIKPLHWKLFKNFGAVFVTSHTWPIKSCIIWPCCFFHLISYYSSWSFRLFYWLSCCFLTPLIAPPQTSGSCWSLCLVSSFSMHTYYLLPAFI